MRMLRPTLEQLSRPIVGLEMLETQAYDIEIVDLSLGSANKNPSEFKNLRQMEVHPIEWDGLASGLHRNSAYLCRRAALAPLSEASGTTDKCPVLPQSCRSKSVRIVILRAPAKSACNS